MDAALALLDEALVLSGEGVTDTRGMFSAEEVEAGWRLACQTLPTRDLTIAR